MGERGNRAANAFGDEPAPTAARKESDKTLALRRFDVECSF